MPRIAVVVLDHRNDAYLQDLIDGIHTFSPGADVHLYNTGAAPAPGTPADSLPVLPASHPLRYAKVTPFFMDLLAWTAGQRYDLVVNAETDMAFVQPGYEDFLARAMRDTDYLAPGFLPKTPTTSRWRPYRSLRPELPELLSIIGMDHTNRCFSPGQVFSARYAERVVSSPWYADLCEFVERNQQPDRSFTLQEVLFPTLAEAMGLTVRDYPAHLAPVNRYRPYHAVRSVLAARTIPDAYFVHPVRREEADRARIAVRALARGEEPTVGRSR